MKGITKRTGEMGITVKNREEKKKIEISKEEECIIFAKKKKRAGETVRTEEQKKEKGSIKNVVKAGNEREKNGQKERH